MNRSAQIDFILATLNAIDVGTLDSIRDKLREAEAALRSLGEAELAGRTADAMTALGRGDIAEFKRIRATLQAKTGHLR
jgi:CRP-like cAMP-binding protein